MKIDRTENSIKGSFWGIVQRISAIILPFATRTILIQKLGVEYVGLNSLFTSILQVLSFSELGFGSAIVFCMYKPIAEDDDETICALLAFIKKIYRIVGIIILVAGVCLVPFIPKLISGDIPSDINIYMLYFIYLFNTAISYLMFSYKTSILSALQRNDIQNFTGFLCTTVLHVFQIVVLLVSSNYYLYAILIPISTIAGNILNSVIVTVKYPQFKARGKINDDLKALIKSKIIPLFGTKIGVVLISSADTLVISAFLGLASVGIYNNYYYIVSAVSAMVLIVLVSMQAGIGNALATESKEKCISIYERLDFLNFCIASVCTTCMICLYQPFMSLWVGNDKMLPDSAMILFPAYFYFMLVQRINIVFKDAAGIWKEDIVREYTVNGLNIIINVITVRFIGIYGVIGSSVIAYVISLPWSIIISCKYILHDNPKKYLLRQLYYFVIAALSATVSFYICNSIPQGIIQMLIRAAICCVVGVGTIILFCFKMPIFRETLEWILYKIKAKGK